MTVQAEQTKTTHPSLHPSSPPAAHLSLRPCFVWSPYSRSRARSFQPAQPAQPDLVIVDTVAARNVRCQVEARRHVRRRDDYSRTWRTWTWAGRQREREREGEHPAQLARLKPACQLACLPACLPASFEGCCACPPPPKIRSRATRLPPRRIDRVGEWFLPI